MVRTVLDLLDECGIAQFAVCRDRILEYLDSPFKKTGEPSMAQQLEVEWEPEFVQWMFDAQLIPAEKRKALQFLLGQAERNWFGQDWEAAQREAISVIKLRRDLGWAFDVAGWAAEKRGDWRAAVNHFSDGMQASWFSDDTVRFRTHWFGEHFGKFAAFRLAIAH